MTESSGPKVGINFSDAMFSQIMARLDGIVGDTNGSAYALTLSTTDNTASLGPGNSVSGGFGHSASGATQIPGGIPAVVGSNTTRTDIIAIQYDPSDSTDPFPCQIQRVAGVEGGSAPSLAAASAGGATPAGGALLPLWQVTRASSQALSQATVVDLRRWTGPTWVIPAGAPLPVTATLGTVVRKANLTWIRTLQNGAAAWVPSGPVDHRGTVPTRGMGALAGAYGLTASTPTPGLPITVATVPGVPNLVTARFIVQSYGSAGVSAEIQVQYSVNGGALQFGRKISTGVLTAADQSFDAGFDVAINAGDTLQLNAAVTAVNGGRLSLYAPVFEYTATASVHV